MLTCYEKELKLLCLHFSFNWTSEIKEIDIP